ncbi:MAG TPA: hypothetical protein VK141_07240 [Nitrosomonas sp.]|nr:hypothetical protein [Nitrosomonas sp.]
MPHRLTDGNDLIRSDKSINGIIKATVSRIDYLQRWMQDFYALNNRNENTVMEIQNRNAMLPYDFYYS